MEYLRLTDGAVVEVCPRLLTLDMISFSGAIPNRINAFLIHPKKIQDELWCVVEGTLMVWLVDCRGSLPHPGDQTRRMS